MMSPRTIRRKVPGRSGDRMTGIWVAPSTGRHWFGEHELFVRKHERLRVTWEIVNGVWTPCGVDTQTIAPPIRAVRVRRMAIRLGVAVLLLILPVMVAAGC